jgi:hypothetical protein
MQGVVEMTVEPEHGTNGYQHALPYTEVEVADIWKVHLLFRGGTLTHSLLQVNGWIRDRLAKRYSQAKFCSGINVEDAGKTKAKSKKKAPKRKARAPRVASPKRRRRS